MTGSSEAARRDNRTNRDAVVVDSVTRLTDGAAGAVAIAASHGGVYAAYVAASRRVRAVILNDAGVGKDEAGIAGLAYLERCGIPAATVAHDTARIGDGADTLARGVISHANARAMRLGCRAGQQCRDALEALAAAPIVTSAEALPDVAEARTTIRLGDPLIVAIDSVSLAGTQDAGAIVVTGSHGGLLGGDPRSALKVDALAAIFNDAGVGIDGAGMSRLPALDSRDIAAATVYARSARIGDARSTYDEGVISAVNRTAAASGGVAGITARAFVDVILEAHKTSVKA